ncbi:DUF4886 domain-containing protein [Niabella aurantiaca]|uniref:DUF4886 domain-containing protein n=1 Tax=Niabella aurantiaca TaxID=379900 RepID=UPI00038100F3|nr:DUF4886 domain-containing protein [Niabella aurantiaca]
MKKLWLLGIAFALSLSSVWAQKEQAVLKVLAIGNSFSVDALENNLYDLAKAANKKIIIGNMYIGGAPIDLHVKNADSNKNAYSYRKIYQNGEKRTTKKVSLAEVMRDEDWDYISLQQASPLSGQYQVIMAGLPKLVNYVRSQAPHAALIYHQTWAYQQNSTHKGFANYDNNQTVMYRAIMDATRRISKSGEFRFIVPAGTAIQNARTSSLGDKLTRDGYHLQLDYGRFAAACVWYEMLFRSDVRKNPYKPGSVTALQARIVKDAAHKAAKKPFRVQKIRL